MKRFFVSSRIMVVAWIAVFVLFFCFSVMAQDGLLNRNPNFEKGSKGMPVDWYYAGLVQPEVTFLGDVAIKKSGRVSASIIIKEWTDRIKKMGPPNWCQDITEKIPVGRKVRLTAWVRTKNVNGMAPVAVQCWNSKAQKIIGFGTTQKTFPMAGTNEWKQVSIEMKVPEGTDKMRILCMLMGTGQVWFDDVELRVVK